MKKTLALVLALAMVFSTVTVAFAEETAAIGADAQVCADLGMLKGATGTVDAAYLATTPTRLQAAIMFLRLKGLEAEATGFTGTDNFADADKVAWAEGKAILAYLKAYPELGWKGDGTNFDPNSPVTAQQYYKVMLEALGYKQNTAEVVGDFTWENVLAFAAEKGLTKVAAVTNFTVNDVATATVEALKAKVKGVDKTLVDSLVEAGKVDKAKAVAAGLVVEKVEVAAAVDSAEALGNTVVEVAFDADVDAAAAGDASNYTIEGLEVKGVTVTGSDTVRLETAAMTAGKLYTLTVGDKSVKFTGIAKVSGGPEITDVVSEDVEEVVITFDKNVDYATATDVANYTIAGVEVVEASVDGTDVTLTTEGLKNKTKYTVKVTNMKSIDGAVKRSDSDTFTSKFDTAAPKLVDAVPETNQRLVVTFNEKVTQETAEDLANYSIKVDETDGAALEIVSATWNSDDEDKVELVTEPMVNNEDYVLTVNGIADQRKAANVMTRPSTKDFEGVDEDERGPRFANADAVKVLSPTKILVTLVDESDIDEASATDVNNYTLEGLEVESIETLENDYQIFRGILTVEEMETGKSYDLTVVDVLDEFGNAMDEDTEVAKATTTNIAAVKAADAVATGENTIVVIFDGELDEASAENLANYSIDDDLGAPTKAVYEYKDYDKDNDKEYVVTLTVNDMVNGFDSYDLTVDGVKDLAGNELYYELTVDTTTNKWDTTEPELKDADILNNKVVALTFNEKVQYGSGAKLILAVNDNEANTIQLAAADYDEDDTVVEFTYAATLDENVQFSVYKVVYDSGDGGIKDLIGNPLLVSDIVRTDFVFEGVDDAPVGVEIDSYEQIDGKTFEVKFPRKVTIDSGEASQSGFTVSYESTGVTSDDKIRFTKASGLIEENVDYTFDFSDFLKDLHGVPVADIDTNNTVTILTGEYKDEDAPYVDEVVADNRTTIKVTFNERINESTVTTDDFALKNYDLDENVTITGISDNTDNDGVILLTVTKPLEARYEYQLTIDKEGVQDIAGLKNAAEESFYFDGTNLKP